MDRQEYLNQISTKNLPNKGGKKSNILSSKFFWVGAIGVGALVLIIIIGSLIGGGKPSGKDQLFSLILHINNTSELIETYQPSVKSSDLRSHSASLHSVLSNTGRELTEFAEEKYNFKEKDIKKDLAEEETTAKDGLEAELFEAKINGILDRIYTHKMAYEISLITNREAQIMKSINNETLNEILTTSYDSLETLYDKFNDFSEAN